MFNKYIEAFNKELDNLDIKVTKILQQSDTLPKVLIPDFSIDYESVKNGSPVQTLTATFQIIDNQTSTKRVDQILTALTGFHQDTAKFDFNVLTFLITNIQGSILPNNSIIYKVSFESKFCQ